MIRFLFAFVIPWAALLAWALLDQRDWFWAQAVGEHWPIVTAKLLLIPVAAAWFAIDAMQWRRPRRAFDPRVHTGIAPLGAGLVAGIVAVLATATGLALPVVGLFTPGPSWIDAYDGAVIAAACTVPVIAVLLAFGRAKQDHCVHCGYDLRGNAGPRCPECGAVGSVVIRAGC